MTLAVDIVTVTDQMGGPTEGGGQRSTNSDKAYMCGVYMLCVRFLVVLVLVLVGVVGNILTMCTLWADRNKSSTMFLLLCLAAADSAVLISYGSMSMPVGVLYFQGNELLASSVLNVVIATYSPLGALFTMMSMGFMVAVTWHRYVSVCLPYKAKTYGSLQVARKQAVGVVVFSVVFNMPRWFEYRYRYDTTTAGAIKLTTTLLARSEVYEVVYGVVCYYLFYYILPIMALVYMTFALVRSLRRAQLNHSTSISKKTKAREEITLSLVIVVVVFIVCQFLGPIRRVLMVLYPFSRQCGGVLFYFEVWALVSICINSAVNFIIFMLLAKRFRRRVVKLFVCRRKQVGPRDDEGQVMNIQSTSNQRLEQASTTGVTLNHQPYDYDNF